MNLEIYKEILLEHNEHPHHFEVIKEATHKALGSNPICGDEIEVFAEVEDAKIKQLSFIGESCAICKASASLMTDTLMGLPVSEALEKAKNFIKILSDEKTPIPENLGDLQALLGVRQFPARLKCATLAWHALIKALGNQ